VKWVGAAHHVTNFPNLYAAHVVELKDCRIGFPAIDTRMGVKVASDKSLVSAEVAPLIRIAPRVVNRLIPKIMCLTLLTLAWLTIGTHSAGSTTT